MSMCGRIGLIACVVMGFMLWGNNGSTVVDELLIQVTNTLDNGSLNLTVTCPRVEAARHLILPADSHQWIYSGDIPSANPPFLCTFQWPGVSHSFDMYVPSRDSDCEECNWRITIKGPCRLHFPNRALLCYNWN